MKTQLGHIKNLKTFTGYIQLKNFQAFGCQATAFNG